MSPAGLTPLPDESTGHSDALLSPSDRESWLRQQAGFDWSATGVPPFVQWPPALATLLRLIAFSPTPQALMWGPRGILTPNLQAQQLLDGALGDITGRSMMDLWPDSNADHLKIMQAAWSGHPYLLKDHPLRLRRDGQDLVAWFDLSFTPITSDTGTVLAVLVGLSEVSRHMRRLRVLSDSEQRMRLALEASGMVGVWALNVQTGITTADANIARTYGLAVEDCQRGVPDSLFIQAIHPDDRAKVGKTLLDAIKQHTPYRCRYRVTGGGADIRWVITSASPSYDEDNKLTRLMGVVVDITDQVETANALADSRFQFQTLTEALPQIVWSCDAEGRHDYFSARWSEFTGIALADIREDTWKELVHPEDALRVSSAWDQARLTGLPYDIDYRFRNASGEFRWLRVMALPIRDETDRITRWFGTSTDVHETYMASQERERMALELERIATEDQLTGVLTRRAFMTRAAARVEQAALTPQCVSLLMLDIDYFKSINDNYGHPVGDQVLSIAAERIMARVKKHDLIGRLGGEEFAILLTECTTEQALIIAERIRRAFETSLITLEGDRPIQVTVSIGLCTDEKGCATLGDLLLIADKALYQAKSSGRNQTEARKAYRSDAGDTANRPADCDATGHA